MISSSEGFRILRKWKTQKAVLWFAVPAFDVMIGDEVRIAEVSASLLKLALGGSGKFEVLDLEGVTFDVATIKDAPFPDYITDRYSLFLYLALSDGRKFVLAESAKPN